MGYRTRPTRDHTKQSSSPSPAAGSKAQNLFHVPFPLKLIMLRLRSVLRNKNLSAEDLKKVSNLNGPKLGPIDKVIWNW